MPTERYFENGYNDAREMDLQFKSYARMWFNKEESVSSCALTFLETREKEISSVVHSEDPTTDLVCLRSYRTGFGSYIKELVESI